MNGDHSVTSSLLTARAYLDRVAEPADLAVWLVVEQLGPVEAALRIRQRDMSGLPERVGRQVLAATEARHRQWQPDDDIDAAAQLGIDFVVPEDPRWPHFAFAALNHSARALAAELLSPGGRAIGRGELVPPIALWVRGSAELASIGVRSVAIVGSRASSPYGDRVAGDLAFGAASRGVQVVSGGAYGIDASAHRGALAAGGQTVLVSAGGLDRPYPAGNDRLFQQAAENGLVISESPPGSAPQRHRFLSRNRLIAALGSATVVVEAARRSGAMNTAAHCVGLGRPLLAVPGPITSTMSVGCHDLLARERNPAQILTGIDDLLVAVGDLGGPATGSAAQLAKESGKAPTAPQSTAVRDQLDRLDPAARRVYDGLPARTWIDPDSLARRSGIGVIEVIRAVPELELAGLIERGQPGLRRLARAPA